MRKFLRMSAIFCGCCISSLSIADVDVSGAYLLPQAELPPNQMLIGGVVTKIDPQLNFVEDFLIEFESFLSHESGVTQLRLLNARPAVWPDNRQQQLRGTTWHGSYYTGQNDMYLTDLHLQIIENGFVKGEIEHKTAEAEPKRKLRVQVLGTITTDFLLNVRPELPENQPVWIESSELLALQAERAARNPDLPPIIVYPNTHFRHKLFLQRGKAITAVHNNGDWGRFNVYDLNLEHEQIVGSLYLPEDGYSKTRTSGHGILNLNKINPL
jgi:hypothetical protein